MRGTFSPFGCASCALNRRQFLSGCLACVSAGSFVSIPGLVRAAETKARSRIRLVFSLHDPVQPGPDWPNKGFDFVPVMERFRSELSRRCANLEFVSATATGEEQARKIVDADKSGSIDGYVVFQMNCWNRVVQPIAQSGKPVLYVDFQYGGSGGFLTYNAGFLRNRSANVGFVASSQIDDLVEAVKCFGLVQSGEPVSAFVAATERVRQARTRGTGDMACAGDALNTLPTQECISRLKQTKILAVRGHESGPAGSIMGIPILHVPFAELNDAWKSADKDQARAVAETWQRTAASVSGVSRETLEQSAAMYLAEKALIDKHHASAITVNCLGGFYGGHIHAYPCLGFHQLLNEGLVGGCECDVRSAAAMVALTTLTQGRPGYISDPVVDTAKRQIIYAHCVASNRAFGPQGEANPFHIMTHSEDRQGASVRSVLPVGYMTTTVQVAEERKEILFHQGKAVANDPDDRACRTKLCAEPVGDIEKLFRYWDQWGWHRVTYYGDLKAPVFALADALGWKVVEEA